MRKMINRKEFSDVNFIVGPNRKVVHANNSVLSARCEVFHAMLTEHKEGLPKCDNDIPLVLADVSTEVFLSLMEFLSTNTCTLNSRNVMEVMGSSMEYGLEKLQKMCEDFIGENLSVDTASEAMQVVCQNGSDRNFSVSITSPRSSRLWQSSPECVRLTPVTPRAPKP